MPPQPLGVGHAGITTAHCPFTQVDDGHAALPSAQVLHSAFTLAQSASVSQASGSRGLQTPVQSAAPVAGSHRSLGTFTQVYPGGQTSPAKPPHTRGLLSGMQTPGQSAPPASGAHMSFGSSTQTYPSAQGNAAIPPQLGWGQVGTVTLHCPFSHVARGQADEPSAHVLHATRTAGH
jgi:hypothetical protein